jgi:hypothetical protein
MSREIEAAKKYAIFLQELSTHISEEARIAFDTYQELVNKKQNEKPKLKKIE